MELLKIDTEKEKLMMEASIKRLELEVKSWHSKFIDKVLILVIRAWLSVNLELRHGKLISSPITRFKGTILPKKSSIPENEGKGPKIDHAHI